MGGIKTKLDASVLRCFQGDASKDAQMPAISGASATQKPINNV